jgi:hypothetical protein
MLLTGYFDESVRLKASDPITVAGYVFKPNNYRQFVRRWKRLRQSAGNVPFIHMTDLFAGEGHFDGIPIARRAEVFAHAVEMINDHMTCGVGICFLQSEFEAVAPPDWAQRSGSIYTAVCQLTMEAAGSWFDEHRRHDSINYVFEDGYKFQHEAEAVINAIGADEGARKVCHYNSHRFASKADAVGLQAADILAWAATKERGWETGDKILEPFLKTLRTMASDRSRYLSKLVTGGGLELFFQEHERALGDGRIIRADPGPRKRTLR